MVRSKPWKNSRSLVQTKISTQTCQTETCKREKRKERKRAHKEAKREVRKGKIFFFMYVFN